MLLAYVMAASLETATTYGYEERMCGDVGKAVPCAKGATTASGIEFDPDQPQIAVHAPKNVRIRKNLQICFLSKNGKHIWLRLVDKKGALGFDLTPESVKRLGYRPHKHWSSKLRLCPNPLKETI